MHQHKIYSSIPEPHSDLDQHTEVLKALKQDVEILMGMRGVAGWANQTIIYRPKSDTDAPLLGSKNGDRWLIPPLLPGETWVESVWYNDAWVRLP